MKHLSLIFVLLTIHSWSIYAQTSDNKKNELEKLKTMLKQDKTNEHPFVEGQYYCHQFASQFYLQNSSLVTDINNFDLQAINREWGTIISRLAESEKLPIYYVTLNNKDHGFFHAINAYLVNSEKPEDILSYIFFEPQTDESFLTPEQLYNRYRSDYVPGPGEEALHVSIGTFDQFKHNGFIYQSLTNKLYQFDIKN